MISIQYDENKLFPIELPGSNQSIELFRIGQDTTGGLYSVVKFPPGFARKSAWQLNVAEDYFLLEGSLEFSKIVTVAGDFANIPSHFTRTDTMSEHGALALARFPEQPEWRASHEQQSEQGKVSVIHTAIATRQPSPLGSAVFLGSDKQTNCRWVEKPTLKSIAEQSGIIFSLASRRMHIAPFQTDEIDHDSPILWFENLL